MSEPRSGRRAVLRRFLRSWYFPAAVGLLLLLALAFWVMPRRVERFVSADGRHLGDAGQVPQRQVLWEQPQSIEGLLPEGDGNFLTPRLADGGATLYFAYRPRGGHADIYCSRLVDGTWQPAEPVAELNSTADDIGPTLSRDGRQLYFYSNRPGGFGGFDLYVSERVGAGWSKPRNLGPRVNSSADEHDPALAPDGLTLYFASNRTPGPLQFDLYAVRRPSPQDDWSAPEALAELNSPGNEVAPFVSPSGSFLYFASDRPARRGVAPNLDLYRARLVEGRFRDAENLGPGVNTDDDETQPALSPEGFTLLFASDRDGARIRGLTPPARLYRSTAQEVTARTEWDTVRLRAIAAVWWQALLLTGLLVGLATAFLYGRGWLFEKATAARFVAASLILHGLLVFLMWGVPLAQSVVRQAEEIRVSEQAPQLADDGPLPSHPDGRPAYAKVAELKSMDPVPLSPVARQNAELPVLPDRPESQLPKLPVPVARAAPPDLQPPAPAQEEPLLGPVPELPRRPRGLPPEVAPIVVRDGVADSAAERRATLAPLAGPAVAQARQEPAEPAPPALELPRRSPRPPGRPAAIEIKPAAEMPEVTVLSPRMPRAERARPQPADPAPVDPGPVAAAGPTAPDAKPLVGAQVTLPRPNATLPEAPAPTPEKIPPRSGSRQTSVTPATEVGRLPSRPLDPAPSLTPLAGRSTRPPASGLRVARVDDNASGAPYLLRQGDVRKEAINLLGGSKESEAAVERGLDWLAAHQGRDGRWSLQGFPANCKHPQCTAAAAVTSDTAGTGLALLPFLAAGYTHKSGKHQQTVGRAVAWLVEQQRVDGGWLSAGDTRPMYGHGLAAIALCEAYGMTRDPALRGPAQKALDFIARAQNPATGGWRYTPNTPGDTSVLGWQVMALKSGELAGLTIPPQALEGAKRWLKSVEGNKPTGGLFGYQNPTPTPAMTAQGLLCLQLMGARRGDPRLVAGADYLLRNLPQRNVDTSYYWYHATQVMYHMQGKYWKAWNERLRDLLVATQITQGSMAGTWNPVDAREKTGGRICSTALRLLMLEVYYRHLPLYQQLEK